MQITKNEFKLRDTRILKSIFDFSHLPEGYVFKGKISISSTIEVPKDVSTDKVVRCCETLTMGKEDGPFQILLKTITLFDITHIDSEDSLQTDATAICHPQALSVLADILHQLTKIHLGQPIDISIPQ